MNRITQLLAIKYPIIQGGMVWNSGWKLASAVSNNGGMGVLGAGSMHPSILKEHIIKCRNATNKPFGINLPLFNPDIEQHIQIIIDEKIPVVFTSAGNPKMYTPLFQKHNIKVVHVVSSLKFALKSVEAGVDALVAEGFEAGGHNGIDETTTFCLIPNIKKHITIPLIAAGGIANGEQILASQVLGADGVQIGSRFAATVEASSHNNYKNAIINSQEGDTHLTLKELIPVRLIKNHFYEEIITAYKHNATKNEILNLLGNGRAKKGMFEGDLKNGELEIGQSSALIHTILTVEKVFEKLIDEYVKAKSIQYSVFIMNKIKYYSKYLIINLTKLDNILIV